MFIKIPGCVLIEEAMGLTAIHAFILCQMLFAMMIESTLEYTKNKVSVLKVFEGRKVPLPL